MRAGGTPEEGTSSAAPDVSLSRGAPLHPPTCPLDPLSVTRPRPASDGRAVARLRKLCLSLPEAVEKPSHGEPTWFAGEKGKVFAMLDDHHHGAEHLSVHFPMPLGAQEALVARDPTRYFRPPYVGGRGWVGLVLDGDPDWVEVERLLREAYLQVAPARLAARLRGGAR